MAGNPCKKIKNITIGSVTLSLPPRQSSKRDSSCDPCCPAPCPCEPEPETEPEPEPVPESETEPVQDWGEPELAEVEAEPEIVEEEEEAEMECCDLEYVEAELCEGPCLPCQPDPSCDLNDPCSPCDPHAPEPIRANYNLNPSCNPCPPLEPCQRESCPPPPIGPSPRRPLSPCLSPTRCI